MKHSLRSLGLVAALPAAFAGAQQAGHQHHGPAPKAEVVAPKAPLASPPSPEPRKSPFASYRAFNPDEPMLDWKAANEAVRAAGGHIGLMKAESLKQGSPAPAEHSGHGSSGTGKKP